MNLIPSTYRQVFRNKNFLNLTLTNVFAQLSFAFLTLILVTSVFAITKSNLGVSGVVLSFVLPGLIFVAIAGIIADIFNRKIIISGSITLIALIVFLIFLSSQNVFLMIIFSFIYHGMLAFYLPAYSAASAQLVRKHQLMVANSVFTLTVVGGQITGFLTVSALQFFFGTSISLAICAILLLTAFFWSTSLPALRPGARTKSWQSIFYKVKEIIGAFLYISKRRLLWFFVIILAGVYGIYAFGATLGPGFFNEVVGLSIRASPLFAFPPVAVGLVAGMVFVHLFKLEEGLICAIGLSLMGFASLILGTLISVGILGLLFWLVLVLFIVAGSFGAVICIITSRTVIQKLVSHRYQGTIFAASIILSALFAAIASPLGVFLEEAVGYVSILFLAGGGLLLAAPLIVLACLKWRF